MEEELHNLWILSLFSTQQRLICKEKKNSEKGSLPVGSETPNLRLSEVFQNLLKTRKGNCSF